MDRVAVFVDAGYLFAAGSSLLAGERLPRSRMKVDVERGLRFLTDLARRLSGLPLLRVYWYDGTSTGPTPFHLSLGYQASVKVRLGFVNKQGQQKGVDSLIVTDMIELGRNRAMADAVLVTGDEDIRIGVQQVQLFGVRVHLVGIAPSRHNQSAFLVQEADGTCELSAPEVRTFMSVEPKGDGEETCDLSATRDSRLDDVSVVLEHVGRLVASRLDAEGCRAVLASFDATGRIPVDHSSDLLKTAARALGGKMLDVVEKNGVREAFLEECRLRGSNETT